MQTLKFKRNPYLIAVKTLEAIGPILGLSIIFATTAIWYLHNSPQHLPVKYKLAREDATGFPKRERTFYLESAQSPEQLYKGLKFRDQLKPDHGMLFSLGGRHTNVGFWMYQVKFPLDIIYLSDGVVTKVVSNAPPCSHLPCPIYYANSATHVLELPAFSASQTNITAGVKLKFKWALP
ncbi:MAG: DUF192 domain-containing protein [Desmonostoc vinosum HA7617-LM4]|jgi:uncharacterized membrane protein (UPF0127 family)|nr:DUF192 domain-containing protein [Desmonostoc vinosum HA7617-LM4]